MAKTYIENIKHTAVRNKIFSLIDIKKKQPIFEVIKLSSGDYLPTTAMINGDFPVYGGGGQTNKNHNQFNVIKRTFGIGRVGARCGCVFEILPNSWVTDNALFAIDISPDYDINFLIEYLNFKNINQFANTSAQPVISLKRMSNITIPIVDLNSQKEIVEILENFENLDFNNQNDKYGINSIITLTDVNEFLSIELSQQLHLVKKLRQQLLQDAVKGDLVEQDPNDEPASILLQKIKDGKEQLINNKKFKRENELPQIKLEETPFDIPKNWVWCRLGNTGILKRGKSKHRPRNDEELFVNGKYPFIQTGDVSKAKSNNDLIKTIHGYYNDFGLKQSELQNKGTLCITVAANIAECGFLDFDACVPDSIVCYKSIDSKIEKYVYYYLKIAKEQLEKFAPATAQKNINLEILNVFPFPIPPLKEQYRIIQKLEQLMQSCDALEDSIKQSQLQNEQLLQQVLREALTKEVKHEEQLIVPDYVGLKGDDKYKALLLAAEIIWQLNQKQTLGHIKLQKLIYLCNRTQKMNLPVNFLKWAMGPYDPELQKYIDKALVDNQWFNYDENASIKYQPLKNAGSHRGDFDKYFMDDKAAINHLIQFFENAKSARIEIVATLFACWDELIMKNQLVNDNSLLAAFYNWSEKKRKYTNEKVIDALRWMETQGIIPK